MIPREPYLRKAIAELHVHGITVMAMPFEGGEKEETYFKLWDMGFDFAATDTPIYAIICITNEKWYNEEIQYDRTVFP